MEGQGALQIRARHEGEAGPCSTNQSYKRLSGVITLHSGGRGQWLGGQHGECGARAYNGGLGHSPQRGPGAEPHVTGSVGAVL